ncbi:MAG: phosphoribosylamine--glycine ligase, partial [Halobacteriaceae archaeon]
NKLFAETLGKLEDWLANEGYVGSIDINCIVNENGIHPLEFTPRFGYPTITIQEESLLSSTGQFFYDLAHGNDPDVDVHKGFQVGVRIVLPPFPFDDQQTYDENSRNAAIVFETDNREGIHIEDVKNVEGQWRVAGENGMPIVVTGKGTTMEQAREQCYNRINKIAIPNLYYRDDIGERWINGNGDMLQAWGFLGPSE